MVPSTSRSAPSSPATATMVWPGSPAARMVRGLMPRVHAIRRASNRTGLLNGSSSRWVMGSVGASRPAVSEGRDDVKGRQLGVECVGEVGRDCRGSARHVAVAHSKRELGR
jgi:hypothetical protein